MTDDEKVIADQHVDESSPPGGRPGNEDADASVPPSFSEGSFKEAKKKWIDYFEENYLRALLDKHKGRLGRAARAAGMDRKTLYRLMRKHTGEEPDE